MRKKSILIFCVIMILITGCGNIGNSEPKKSNPYNKFGGKGVILRQVSGSENRELEPIIQKYAKKT